ncbi:hypothetical protein [Natrinema sp. 74]|uniref:hypothetical protein n=1 Tax=Natrinema sp. 74 TaxID=3384159 RepID=UPI0038D469E8
MTSTGISGSIIGVSGTAAGSTHGDAEPNNLTREEVEAALDDMEVRPETGLTGGKSDAVESGTGRSAQQASVLDDVKIYVGKYRNSEPPAGKPFAIESYEEYLERDAPPGFDPYHGRYASQQASAEITNSGTEAMATSASGAMDFFYLKEDIGAVSLAGYEFSVGVGLGVRIHGTTAASLEAELSVDVYIGGASFSLSSFTVGYGISDRGFCIGPVKIDYGQIPGLTVEICGEAGFTSVGGDELEVRFGPTLDVCVDPCPVITCSYCQSQSVSTSVSFPNPI